MTKTHKAVAFRLTSTILVLVLLCSLFACTSQSQKELAASRQQEMQIIGMLHQADYSFYTLISWEKRDGSKDGIYYTGVIEEKLDAILDELVSAYNADPSTKEPVSIESVRYDLTEGIAEATKDENWESSFAEFLRWTDAPAELEYNGYDTDTDGTEHFEGEDATKKGITNYIYFKNPEDYPNYRPQQ